MDSPMTGTQGTSSSNLNSLNPAPIEVCAIPDASVAPPVMDVTTSKNSLRSPLSLWKDSGDASETSTVCDIAVDTSLIEGGNAPVTPESPAREINSNQLASLVPQNSPSAGSREPPGTLSSCVRSQSPLSTSPSYTTQNGPSGKDGNPDLEAALKTEVDGGRTEADEDANVRRWKEEIDMLLVFAGLFSGVVTGFLTESTKSLRPEPTADTVAILEHISAQLLDHQAIPDLAPEVFVPSRETVQINCLWFISLILSLGVAFVSILVKWWLQGHSSCLVLSWGPEKRTRAAQHPHAVWRVQAIMTALPILLLVALVLFCAGLSILLITLDTTVGVVAMCLIGFVFLFSSATTIFLSQK